MRNYSENPDGTIAYIDRKWFIERLVDNVYMNMAANNCEDDKEAQNAAECEEIRLKYLDDEQLAQEYADRIGDPREE